MLPCRRSVSKEVTDYLREQYLKNLRLHKSTMVRRARIGDRAERNHSCKAQTILEQHQMSADLTEDEVFARPLSIRETKCPKSSWPEFRSIRSLHDQGYCLAASMKAIFWNASNIFFIPRISIPDSMPQECDELVRGVREQDPHRKDKILRSDV